MTAEGDTPPRVLLVEGPDDKHVVGHLRQLNGLESVFCISDKGSDYSVLESIAPELMVSGRIALGIMLDANSNPFGRWQAVASRLCDVGIQLPNAPSLHGTIIQSSPRVGVWLMPDNQSDGELEDFVERMIPANDVIWPLSQDYIDQIPKADRKFAEGKTLRAKVHAWLAAREHPRRMGSAIGVGDLDVDVETTKKFVTWLRQLFT